MTSSFFESLAAASGLSPIFAKATLERVVTRAGLDPDTLTGEQIGQLKGDLERALATYLDPDEARRRVEDISRMASAR